MKRGKKTKMGFMVAMVLMAVTTLVCVGCTKTEVSENDSKVDKMIETELIIRTDLAEDEISDKIIETIEKNDYIEVLEITHSEENKYLVTVSCNLIDEEIVEILEKQDWVEKVQINYELTMY